MKEEFLKALAAAETETDEEFHARSGVASEDIYGAFLRMGHPVALAAAFAAGFKTGWVGAEKSWVEGGEDVS